MSMSSQSNRAKRGIQSTMIIKHMNFLRILLHTYSKNSIHNIISNYYYYLHWVYFIAVKITQPDTDANFSHGKILGLGKKAIRQVVLD